MVIATRRVKFKRGQSQLLLRRLLIFFVKLTGLSAVLAFAWGLYSYILTSPYFFVMRIDYAGLERLDRDEFDEFLNIPPKTNIFTIDLDSIRKKAESHPWVRSAEVTRQLPDVLEIRVEEHDPVAIVEYEGELFYVNNYGEVFKKVRPGENMDLPVLTISFKGKSSREEYEKNIKGAVEFLKKFSGINPSLYSHISEINFDSNGLYNIFFSGVRMQVVFHSENIEKELAQFNELLSWSDAKSVIPVYVYFAKKSRAIVKFRKNPNITAYNLKSIMYADKKAGDKNG